MTVQITAKVRRKCRQKAAYQTWVAARDDARKLWKEKGRALRPYLCVVCQMWHLHSVRGRWALKNFGPNILGRACDIQGDSA